MMDKYLCCNADESEPGTFKDRLLMQKNPHLLVEGCIIGAIAAGANKGFIFIRGEYELQADILDAAVAEAYDKGYLGERILGSATSSTSWSTGARAPTSGEETGLLDALEGKRGNPWPEAALPREPGPLPGPDADQQRRDALQRAAHHREGRRVVSQPRRRQPTGTKIVSVWATCSGPATTRSSSACPCARSSMGSPAGRPTAARSSASSRRSSAPVLTQEHLDLPLHVRGHGEAGSMLGSGRSSSSTSRSRSWRWPCGWPSSTATSRAASASPAARAPTGR